MCTYVLISYMCLSVHRFLLLSNYLHSWQLSLTFSIDVLSLLYIPYLLVSPSYLLGFSSPKSFFWIIQCLGNSLLCLYFAFPLSSNKLLICLNSMNWNLLQGEIKCNVVEGEMAVFDFLTQNTSEWIVCLYVLVLWWWPRLYGNSVSNKGQGCWSVNCFALTMK